MNGANRNLISAFVVMLALAFAVAGCGGKDTVKSARGSDSDTSASSGNDLNTEGMDDRGLVGVDADDRAQFLDPNNPLSTRVFYFEFDSDAVSSEYDRALEAHANYLKKHSAQGLTIRLEGHADERGTPEYNVALGERRANAIKKVLMLKGVPSEHLNVISYGEERPAVDGHDEDAWAKNRRVELVYPAR